MERTSNRFLRICDHIVNVVYVYNVSSQMALMVKKNPPANTGDIRDVGSIPGLGRSPGRGNGNPLQVVLPGESHGQRNLVGYSP